VVWTCEKDECKQATTCCTTWTCGRSRGGQWRNWMDNIRKDLREKGSDLNTIREPIRNREVWRSFIVKTLMEEKKEEEESLHRMQQ
jgi:hypothetical protein